MVFCSGYLNEKLIGRCVQCALQKCQQKWRMFAMFVICVSENLIVVCLRFIFIFLQMHVGMKLLDWIQLKGFQILKAWALLLLLVIVSSAILFLFFADELGAPKLWWLRRCYPVVASRYISMLPKPTVHPGNLRNSGWPLFPPYPPLPFPHERSSTKNSNFASPGRPSVDLLTKKTRLGSVVRIAGLNLTNHFEHILSTSDPADGILVNGTPGNSMHGVRRHHLDSIRGMNQHQGCGGWQKKCKIIVPKSASLVSYPLLQTV